VAILEGRFFFSQPELFESFLNCSVWLDKTVFHKGHFFYGHLDKLYKPLGHDDTDNFVK